uniref:Uncharacterized protein n=1 Tax=Anopheles minimus TaxID=112268 RepID=A0A182WMZ0_9DIPT
MRVAIKCGNNCKSFAWERPLVSYAKFCCFFFYRQMHSAQLLAVRPVRELRQAGRVEAVQLEQLQHEAEPSKVKCTINGC